MKVTKEKSVKSKLLLLVLGVMMMADYLLTWHGINNLGVIAEANFMMAWLFEVNFLLSFALRLIMVLFVLWIINLTHKYGDRYFKLMISFAIALNLVVMFLHCRWLYLVYSYSYM